MNVFLDVLAVCQIDDKPAHPIEPQDAEQAQAPAPVKPAMPAPSGMFLIHVAPSPRLDPSKPEDVRIVDDLDESALDPFIVD